MPILMIALLALAVFGVIGGLLTAAVVLETKKVNASQPAAKTSVGKPAAGLERQEPSPVRRRSTWH